MKTRRPLIQKIQIPIRVTVKDYKRFERCMQDKGIEYATQLARQIVLEYLDKHVGDKK